VHAILFRTTRTTLEEPTVSHRVDVVTMSRIGRTLLTGRAKPAALGNSPFNSLEPVLPHASEVESLPRLSERTHRHRADVWDKTRASALESITDVLIGRWFDYLGSAIGGWYGPATGKDRRL
jgi:hypothetical protein